MMGRLFGEGPSSAFREASGSNKRRKRVRQVNESLYEFHKPKGRPSMQIVFFHGIHLGDSMEAHLDPWESEDGSFWPQKWLAEDFPGAYIYTATYSGGVGKDVHGGFDMYVIAESLLSDMISEEIGQMSYCPVVLVGHCFGGIVIKQLCLEASKPRWNSRQGKTFLNNVRGIFYYGTPHHGFPFLSKQVDLLESPLASHLKVLSTKAARLKSEFDQLRGLYANWRIHSIGESLPTNSILFQNVVAVPEASARDGECFNLVATDHSSICKPESKIDRRFAALENLLQDVARTSEEESRVDKESSMQGLRPENFQHIPKEMVDMHVQVEEIVSKLETVRILGLAGMGGLGKTTLAKVVFNTLGPKFDYSCFVSQVKLINGREDDVKDVLWKSLHFRGRKVGGDSNLSVLRGKPVLLVLDDVSDRERNVLVELAEDTDPGSRFILTSRERDLLKDFMGEVHEVPFLNNNHAKLLFMEHAFLEPVGPCWELQSLLEDIVKKCDGLPLALEVVGKYLRGKVKQEVWKETLSALEKAEKVKNLNQKLWAKLRLSFDGLEENEQRMFLDATNFFCGNQNWTLREAKMAWRTAYGTVSELFWQSLVVMSLVYDGKEEERIRVHEQIRSLGRMIASEPNYSGQYQLLKYQCLKGSDGLEMLGTSDALHGKEVHSLRVVFHNTGESILSSTISLSFLNLSKLRFLEVDWPIQIVEAKEGASVPTQLVVLKCVDQALLNPALQKHLAILEVLQLESVPSSFGQFSKLQHLSIGSSEPGPDQGFHFLPESFCEISSLTFLRLRSRALQCLPESFGQLRALQDLRFEYCSQLTSLPDSFGELGALRDLHFRRCDSLRDLPVSFGQLKTLQDLEFFCCRSLRSLPESFGQLSALKQLKFQQIGLEFLPHSFGQLSGLESLWLFNCPIQSLPESFGRLSALKYLTFMICPKLNSLPTDFGKLSALSYLAVWSCRALRNLPESFGQLTNLQRLGFSSDVEELPNTLGNLTNLRYLRLMNYSATKIPDCIRGLPSLRVVEIYNAKRIVDPWPPWLVDRKNAETPSHHPSHRCHQVWEVRDGILFLIEDGLHVAEQYWR